RGGASEVLLEGVVGEFEAFLRAVGPQVAVHAPVDGLTVLVESRAPGVVPHSSPIGLLLVADDVGDLLQTGLSGCFESTQLCESTGTCSENGDLGRQCVSPVFVEY